MIAPKNFGNGLFQQHEPNGSLIEPRVDWLESCLSLLFWRVERETVIDKNRGKQTIQMFEPDTVHSIWVDRTLILKQSGYDRWMRLQNRVDQMEQLTNKKLCVIQILKLLCHVLFFVRLFMLANTFNLNLFERLRK